MAGQALSVGSLFLHKTVSTDVKLVSVAPMEYSGLTMCGPTTHERMPGRS